MASMSLSEVDLKPILDHDLPMACEFMRRTLAPHYSLNRWLRAFSQNWAPDKLNHGYMLVAKGQVVGTGCGIYATRVIGGQTFRWCNLTSWSVLPPYRGKSLALLNRVLSLPDHTYTNFSPIEPTRVIFKRRGFKTFDCD